MKACVSLLALGIAIQHFIDALSLPIVHVQTSALYHANTALALCCALEPKQAWESLHRKGTVVLSLGVSLERSLKRSSPSRAVGP